MRRTPLIALLVTLMISTFISQAVFARSDYEPVVRDQGSENTNYPYVTVLESSNQSVRLVFQPPSPVITSDTVTGSSCQQVRIEELEQSSDLTLPPLPVQGVLLGIPADSQPVLEILDLEVALLPGSYALCPQAQPILEPGPEMPGWQEILQLEKSTIPAQDVFLPKVTAEIVETGFIRSQRYLQLKLNPVQYNSATGELRYYSKIEVIVSFASGTIFKEEQLDRIDEGVFEVELQDHLLNYEQSTEWRLKPAQSNLQAVLPSYNGNFYKIIVEQDGIYQLTYEKLLEAGLPVETINPDTLRLYDQGNEIAMRELGDGDNLFESNEKVLFYGKALNSKYAKSNVYWLTWGGNAGLRMQSQTGIPTQGYPVPPSFQMTQHFEKDISYMSEKPSGDDQDHWYWANVTHFSTTPTAFKVNLGTLPVAGSDTITVSGFLRGNVSTPFHLAKIYLNGTLLGVVDFPMNTDKLFSFSGISQTLLVPGENTLAVLTPLENGVTFNTVLVNWFEITYNDAYLAEVDQLYFDSDQAGSWQIQVDKFTSTDLELYDLTDPSIPVIISNYSIEATANGQKLTFETVTTGERNYFAQSTAKRLQPAYIIADSPSNWISTQNAADYLIISHTNFLGQAQNLADYRHLQGYQTVVIDVQDIYDEFNDGELSPLAIQDFLTHAYANWSPPKLVYVLLFGDGHFDFRNNYGFNETNFIPPYMADVDPWRGETAIDNRYACVSGDDILPDLRLGRLPVRTTDEAAAAVQKIIAYETTLPADGWNANLSFVADDADDGGEYAADTDGLISSYLPTEYSAEKIYYPTTHASAIAVKTALKTAINTGRLIVHYAGHSGIQKWGDESFWALTDIGTLTNSTKLPFVLPMTCLEGNFAYASPSSNVNKNASLGETFVRKTSGGAIASWSPTGYGLHSGHMLLEANLFDNLFNRYHTELGYLTTAAKLNLYATTAGYRDLIDTYVLFGDPALRLQTIPVPLESPTLLTATTVSWDQVALSWQDNSDSEDAFRIERMLDGISGWTQIAELSANVTSYTDTNLTESTAYYYRVRAYREADWMLSDYSNTANATTLEHLDPPSELTAAMVTYARIDLTWQDNSDSEVSFRIERSVNHQTSWQEVAQLGADSTSWTDTDLTLETVYFYRVRAYRDTDLMFSEYSNIASATTLTTINAPTNLAASMISDTWVTLTWQDNSLDESEFQVERSADGVNNWELIAQLTADINVYSDENLIPEATYYYRVRAYRAVDMLPSGYSNTATVTTLPLLVAPSELTALTISWDRIALSWLDNSESQDVFYIERSLDGLSGWEQIAEVMGDISNYTDTGLTELTTYFYRLRAYRDSDLMLSEYSNTAEATTLDFLEAPTMLSANHLTMDAIDLFWQDNSDSEDKFLIERSPDGLTGWEQIAEVAENVTSYSDSALSNGSPYYYRLRAYRAADSLYSEYSNVAGSQFMFANYLPLVLNGGTQ